jgi:hypothetical protein
MSTKHKHHIIPKHMGGSDDPSNLTDLTIKEHAEAHRLLYEEYGKIQDYLAWKGLEGLIGKEDIIRTIHKAGYEKGGNTTREMFLDPEKRKVFDEARKRSHRTIAERRRNSKEYNDTYLKQCSDGFKGKHHTEETKKRIGAANAIAVQGVNNGAYGKMWIHNPELKESKRISKDDPIPEGWVKGRKMKF